MRPKRVHRLKPDPKTCLFCGSTFFAKTNHARYCTKRCQSIAAKRRVGKNTKIPRTNGGVRRCYRGLTPLERAIAVKESKRERAADYYKRNAASIQSRMSQTRRDNIDERRRRERIASRKWMLKDRTRFMDSYYGRRYGITSTHKAEIVEAQGGKCAICGGEMKRACIDHCHETGTIRGILCDGCNLGIGGMRDSIDNLRAAIAYLERAARVNATCGEGREGKDPICVHCEDPALAKTG